MGACSRCRDAWLPLPVRRGQAGCQRRYYARRSSCDAGGFREGLSTKRELVSCPGDLVTEMLLQSLWRTHSCVPRRESELLISWNLGRADFVHQPEIRARKDGFGGGEFLTQVADCGIVGRLGQMMKTDGQRLGFGVWSQIDLGVVDLSQQSPRILGAFQLFADRGSHAGFRAIRDHFYGVEEILSLRAQSREAVRFRQVLNGDVAGCLFAPLLELHQCRLDLLDAFLQFSLMLLVTADRR